MLQHTALDALQSEQIESHAGEPKHNASDTQHVSLDCDTLMSQ